MKQRPNFPWQRKVYRFRKPACEEQRTRWDRILRNGAAAELLDAAESFGRLTDEVADDVEAWFNRAPCLAWAGKDRQAIECLDQAVGLGADRQPDHATEAWVLAEILRQGGGAENLSDELRYACTFAWSAEQTASLRAAHPEIRQIPAPRDPMRSDDSLAEIEVMEWIDRRFPEPSSLRGESDLPRVLATIYITSGTIRLSSPRVDTLEIAEEKLRRMLGAETKALERVAAPLPLPFLDADVWTVRLPEDLDRELAHRLSREALESYYENHWIHRPRQGLDGLTPLAASQDARRGDTVARVKLTAVIQVREQLGSRGSAVAMYQGYPFDRLRRRLGLDLVHPASVELQDLCVPPALPNCRTGLPKSSTTSAWWRRASPRPGSAMMSSPPASPPSWCAASPTILASSTSRPSTPRWCGRRSSAAGRTKLSIGCRKPARSVPMRPDTPSTHGARDLLADRPARPGSPYLRRIDLIVDVQPAGRARRRRDASGQSPS